MKKIIIHAGIPKTGSTSIQKNLFLNQNKEKKSDFAYITFTDGLDSHINCNRYFNNKKNDKSINDLLKKIEKVHSSKTIIISAETIWNADKNILDYFFKEIFKKNYDAKIFAYLRRQDKFAMSFINQIIYRQIRLIKNSSEKIEILNNYFSFFENGSYSLNYYNNIKYFLKYFPKNKIKIRIYDRRVLKDGDINADFFDWIKLDYKIKNKIQYNMSINDNKRAFLLSIMKEIYQSKIYLNNHNIKNHLKKIKSNEHLTKINIAAQRKDFCERFRESNSNLQELIEIHNLNYLTDINHDKDKMVSDIFSNNIYDDIAKNISNNHFLILENFYHRLKYLIIRIQLYIKLIIYKIFGQKEYENLIHIKLFDQQRFEN